jgi:hypothetical protein
MYALLPTLRYAKLQTEKLQVNLQHTEYLFVADLQFRQQFLLLHLNAIFSLVGKIALIHLETPEIEKGLHTTFTKIRALGRIL